MQLGRMRQRSVVVAFAILTAACSNAPEQQDSEISQDVIAKVRVYQDGRITLDGAPLSLDDLQAALARLKDRGGVVWYYRESGESEPHANASAVIQAIVAAQLPISLSSEEDFSNVVLPNGTTRPRE